MSKSELFDGLPELRVPERQGRGQPRLRVPERSQVGWEALSLDELLPLDHRARLVWSFVEALDLSELYAKVKAVEGRPGHPPADPRLLLGLWLYATIEHVGSARALDRLCSEHHGFRWMCGGVSMNYHALADFRVSHGEVLDRLLTRSFAVLLHTGVASLKRVAQDGMRVRADAGAASFRRRRTLEQWHQVARGEVVRLRTEVAKDPTATTAQRRKARERAAREREARIAEALGTLAVLERQAGEPAKPEKEPPDTKGGASGGKKPKEPRVSTTDPEARIMKMADGGYRPSFNVQFATDTGSQLIAGVAVGNLGNDQGQIGPMVDQLTERYDQRPAEVLVDGGFIAFDDMEAASAGDQTILYAPVPKPRDPSRDPHAALARDTPVIAAWRARMGTPAAQEIYKERAATAECANALARNRGLQRFTVRGLVKAKAIALWFALAHNMMRASSLANATT